jgi:myosin heavy subunit
MTSSHQLFPLFNPCSRFGKYIKLQYDKKRRLVGAWTDHFLLEKSRLVHVDSDERNYHM